MTTIEANFSTYKYVRCVHIIIMICFCLCFLSYYLDVYRQSHNVNSGIDTYIYIYASGCGDERLSSFLTRVISLLIYVTLIPFLLEVSLLAIVSHFSSSPSAFTPLFHHHHFHEFKLVVVLNSWCESKGRNYKSFIKSTATIVSLFNVECELSKRKLYK
jgi:hypothetical protein